MTIISDTRQSCRRNGMIPTFITCSSGSLCSLMTLIRLHACPNLSWNSSFIPLVVCNYMHYVKHILMPNEKVLYDSRVHPRVLVPGMLVLGVAAFILHVSAHTGHWHSILLS